MFFSRAESSFIYTIFVLCEHLSSILYVLYNLSLCLNFNIYVKLSLEVFRACRWFCRCDSVERLRSKCGALEQDIVDPLRFKDFYQFTFNYAKNPGQKGLGKRKD